MVSEWEFATAGRIRFGPGTCRELADAVRAVGRRPLLVAGRHVIGGPLALALDPAATVAVEGEPTVDTARDGARVFRDAGCDLVVGIGGGSALDAAKAIAALGPNSGEPLDYLEVIGRARPLGAPAAPCIAVPTTAGTGSEVTRNAVLGSPADGVKASLRHASMLPRLAIVDPELMLTLPPPITAATGLDALTQLIEPYVSRRATPITDAICLEGIARVVRSLARAAGPEGHRDLDARTDMALASLFGGIALANAGLGVVHGLAAPIGGAYPVPHAAVCAALLPHGMAANLRALRARAPEHPAIDRYRRVAAALTGSASAAAEDGVEAVAALCRTLEVRGLGALGVTPEGLDEICRRAQQASSMKANPVPLLDGELRALVAHAL